MVLCCSSLKSRCALRDDHQVSTHGKYVPVTSNSAWLAWVIIKIRTGLYSGSSKCFKSQGSQWELIEFNNSPDLIQQCFARV